MRERKNEPLGDLEEKWSAEKISTGVEPHPSSFGHPMPVEKKS